MSLLDYRIGCHLRSELLLLLFPSSFHHEQVDEIDLLKLR
jgi:hypothetical protein